MRAGPFQSDAPALGDVLKEALGSPRFTRLDIVVAWAKRSGLSRLEAELRRFRARGGYVATIVGIDERGATRQGLTLARELSDEILVFHEPKGGTFHPKLYVFRGTRTALVLVGSANLTRGGLYSNYELSVEIEFDLPQDQQQLDVFEEWIRALRSEEQLCLELSDELMARLGSSRALRDEDERRETANDDSDATRVSLPFGARSRRHFVVPTSGRALTAGMSGSGRASRGRTRRAATTTPVTAAGGPPAPAMILARRWFKRFDASGAQQPPRGGTNVTGNLRLTRSVLPIDWRTYFRRDLFGGAAWRTTSVQGRPAEEATISFDVTIAGRFIGTRRLRVSHAAHREAGQANVTTVLHWGTELAAVLRATDYTDWWVVIERDLEGRYALRIQREQPIPV